MITSEHATETVFIYRARSLDFSTIDPNGDLWVAFDRSGVWIAHGKVSGRTPATGRELAEYLAKYLFHSTEIASVESTDDAVIVELIRG